MKTRKLIWSIFPIFLILLFSGCSKESEYTGTLKCSFKKSYIGTAVRIYTRGDDNSKEGPLYTLKTNGEDVKQELNMGNYFLVVSATNTNSSGKINFQVRPESEVRISFDSSFNPTVTYK